MTQYAKLIEGALQLYTPRHISNPRADVLESYALAHGFKPIIKESQPHRLATPYYRETEKQIRLSWEEPSLEDARSQIIGEVNEEKNRILATTQIIEVNGKQYDFNAQAISNLKGALLANLDQVEWTLSDYTLTTLDKEGLNALMLAFLQTTQSIYAWQAAMVQSVKDAESAAHLASLDLTYLHDRG